MDMAVNPPLDRYLPVKLTLSFSSEGIFEILVIEFSPEMSLLRVRVCLMQVEEKKMDV